MNKLLDISITLSRTTVTYPGDPKVKTEPLGSHSESNGVVVHNICLGSHSGTHIDAPYHMLREGAQLHEVALTKLIGECIVIDCTDCESTIDRKRLSTEQLSGFKRILLKTSNSDIILRDDFRSDYVHLTPDGAEYLAGLSPYLVGIDYLSIGEMGPLGRETHRILLTQDVLIVEGLNLSEIGAGRYEIICLPLKLDVGDGAPVRAVLRTLSD